ncbi:hypothetical protein DVA76_18685, partial [Acinetobacter baumannii]
AKIPTVLLFQLLRSENYLHFSLKSFEDLSLGSIMGIFHDFTDTSSTKRLVNHSINHKQQKKG